MYEQQILEKENEQITKRLWYQDESSGLLLPNYYNQNKLKEVETHKMTEQQTNWLDEEAKQFTQHADYEELPSLKLQPNVIAEITIDFSKPFQTWKGEQNGKTITKKIVPVTLAGQKMNWWLNIKNPIYKDVINAGKAGQKILKVLQTGTQANTKYVLVK